MAIFGIILLMVATGLMVLRQRQINRAFRLKVARTATVAELATTASAIAQEIGGGNWRDYVKLWGTIVADTPLTSELKQQPCVSYTVSVVREYEETEETQTSNGQTKTTTRRSSETLSNQRQSAPFYLEDATGRIAVDPEGAEIHTIEVLNQFQPGEPEGGVLSLGNFSLAIGTSHTPQRRTLGYRYREAVLPVNRSALVVGMVSDFNNGLTITQPTDSAQPFIISLKNDETLTSHAERSAKQLLYTSIACALAGLGAILWGLFS